MTRCGVIVLLAALHGWAGLVVPELTGRVVDQADILSQAGEQRLSDRIRDLERVTGGQMAVLTVPSLDGDSLEGFGLRVAESWKIGRKGQDNGALLLISLKDRKTCLEIGHGWEGPICDARAGDIIRGMGSYFRRKEYAQGIEFAVGEVRRMVIGEQGTGSAVPGAGSLRKELGDVRYTERNGTLLLPVIAAFVGVVLLVCFLSWMTARRGWYICYGNARTSPGSDSGRDCDPRTRDYGWTPRYHVGSSSGRTGDGGGYSCGGGRFGGGGASGGW